MTNILNSAETNDARGLHARRGDSLRAAIRAAAARLLPFRVRLQTGPSAFLLALLPVGGPRRAGDRPRPGKPDWCAVQPRPSYRPRALPAGPSLKSMFPNLPAGALLARHLEPAR